MKNKVILFLFYFHFSCYSMGVNTNYSYTLAIVSAFIKYHDINPKSLLTLCLDSCYLPALHITLQKKSDGIILTTSVSIPKNQDYNDTTKKDLATRLLQTYQNKIINLDSYTHFHRFYTFGIDSENYTSIAVFETNLAKEEVKDFLNLSILTQ